MNKVPLLIIGSSGHAKVVIDIVEKQNFFSIIGLIDSFRNIGQETLGYKVLGAESAIFDVSASYENLHLFIAIGDNAVRFGVYNQLQSLGLNLPFATLVHPSAIIGKEVSIGCGTVVMAGAVINPDAKIGDFAIINTSCSIDHDCKISDFATISPGAVLGGNVKIGRFSVVSLGASIKHGLSIGEDSIIGAGAVVIKSIPNHEIHIGVPARKLSNRSHGEKYL